MNVKIAVIGGGSTYTPELIAGLIAEAADLGLGNVTLQDVDAERLDIVGGFCRRMARAAGVAFSIDCTEDQAQALQDADYVLTQIRVGGQRGRHKDIQLGLRHGLVGQETTGVGGFAKALRTVPVLLEICQQMEQLCPRAWLINFTNPSGLVTEAILKHGRARALGLCNNPINLHRDMARHLQVAPERIELDYLGLNHLSWVRQVLLDGKDVLPDTLAELASAGLPANMDEELDYPADFLAALGMVPSSYLRFYYRSGKMVADLQSRPRSRAEEVMAVEAELLADYADPQRHEMPAGLEKRGGALYSRAALDLIRAIQHDENSVHIVNVGNGSTLGCLPATAVVEIPARIGAHGASPLPRADPPPSIRGLMQHVKAYEELAVEAAVTRSRQTALLALVTHPLVADVELASQLVDEIAKEHAIEFK